MRAHLRRIRHPTARFYTPNSNPATHPSSARVPVPLASRRLRRAPQNQIPEKPTASNLKIVRAVAFLPSETSNLKFQISCLLISTPQQITLDNPPSPLYI